MAKVDYGAVALIPKGDFNATAQYAVNDLVSYNGSSFIVKTVPPIGTLPTNTAYFTVNASGTSPATPSTVGTVKPDNSTIGVDENGVISVKSEVLDRVSSSEQALTVNLLNPTLASHTENGITITRNADNTYTLNGAATQDTYLIVKTFTASKNANVRITGCPQGGTAITFYAAVAIASGGAGTVRDLGYGATKQLSAGEAYSYLIAIKPGYICDNLVFKPMLTTNLSATYDDYVPYSGSSGKLDTDFKTLSASIAQNTTDIAANAAGISALNTGLTNTSSRTITPLNNFTIENNDYRCKETIFGFHLNSVFFAPQLSSDAWYSIAEFTSAFRNTYDNFLDAFAYVDGALKKFDVSIISTGNLTKINVFLPSNMSEKKFSLKFYVGRAGQR